MARTPAPGAQATRHGQRGGSEPFSARGVYGRVQSTLSSSGSPGSAFVACRRRDLDLIFSLQFERTVNRDNTVSFQNLTLQIEKVNWRGTLAGCTVTVQQHLDGTLSITYGPQRLGRYT